MRIEREMYDLTIEEMCELMCGGVEYDYGIEDYDEEEEYYFSEVYPNEICLDKNIN